MWKIIALLVVLLVCLTSAKLCEEEEEHEALKVKLLDLEHECKTKTEKAFDCSTALHKRLIVIKRMMPKLIALYRYYQRNMQMFEDGEAAMRYQHLFSEKSQEFLGKFLHISSLYKPAIEASYNKTKSFVTEAKSATVVTVAYTKFSQIIYQARVLKMLCGHSKIVYDAIIKCEGEFVGEFGDEVKKYTDAIINGVNSGREDVIKEADTAIALCEKLHEYRTAKLDTVAAELVAVTKFNTALTMNYKPFLDEVMRRMETVPKCYYQTYEIKPGRPARRRVCYKVGDRPEGIDDSEFDAALKFAQRRMDLFAVTKMPLPEIGELGGFDVITTPLDPHNFPSVQADVKHVRKFNRERVCLRAKDVCTKPAFECFIRA